MYVCEGQRLMSNVFASFWDRISHKTWILPIWPCEWFRKSHGSASSALGLQMHTTDICWGDKIRSSACVASISQTELYPQPQIYSFDSSHVCLSAKIKFHNIIHSLEYRLRDFSFWIPIYYLQCLGSSSAFSPQISLKIKQKTSRFSKIFLFSLFSV